jgi:plasmid stabilization system protein ParE
VRKCEKSSTAIGVREMTKVVRSPAVRIDIAEIVERFCSLDLPQSTERFLAAIDETFALLPIFPEMGSAYESDDTELVIRTFSLKSFPSYVVYYIVRPHGLYVLRVLHGNQSVEAF